MTDEALAKLEAEHRRQMANKERRHAEEKQHLRDQLHDALAENERLRAAAEEVLSWNTGDTSTLLSNPPQNAGLFHAQRVLRAALEKKP